MANEPSENSSSTGFLLGAIVVVLAGVVWYLATDGNMFGQKTETTIKIEVPDIKLPVVKE